MYALALTRSGKIAADGTAAPWPWTIGVGGQRRQFENRAQAQAALARFGQHTEVEVGIMGLPLRAQRPDAAASDLLDPATNLRLAATELAERLRATPNDPALAVGRFAHPDDRTAARTFGRRVLAIAAALDDAAQRRRAIAIRMITGTRPEATPAEPVARLIRAAARRHGVDPAFALAIAKAESGFRHAAVSPKGARGVMQLMPGTAARYGADPRNLEPEHRRRGALSARSGGAVRRRSGPGGGRLQRRGRRGDRGYGRRVPPFPETQRYVPRVLAAREGYR